MVNASPNLDHVTIKTVSENGTEVFFKIKRSTPLEKLFAAYCLKEGQLPASVRFEYGGKTLVGSETAEFLNMRSEDAIAVRVVSAEPDMNHRTESTSTGLMARTWARALKRPIQLLARSFHTKLDSESEKFMTQFTFDLLTSMGKRAESLRGKRSTLTARDVDTASRLVLPRELAIHTRAEGTWLLALSKTVSPGKKGNLVGSFKSGR
jgi:small ubiquitin-related modifier